MYHSDTSTLTVSRYEYDADSGAISSPVKFARWTSEDDRPDGAAVDCDGNVWLALYRGGRVVQISRSGEML